MRDISKHLTRISAVSVMGGRGMQDLSMSEMAAVQFPWQVKTVLTIPPLIIPGKA